MASPLPAKSQPLHNFTLPHLKWNKDRNSGGHHQRRRSIKSPSRRPNISDASPVRQSPLSDSVSTTPPRHQSPGNGNLLGKRSPTRSPGESSKPHPTREWGKHSPTSGDPVYNSCKVKHNSTSEGVRNGLLPTTFEKSKAKEAEVSEIKRSKILIKIPCKNCKTEDEHEDVCRGEVQEDEKINQNNIDEETKIWNLRPRKPMPERSKAESPVKNRSGENGGKKDKRKLSISIPLSKEEIEEDIFALTGSKPVRRPKKRAKNIQKQVNAAFPGLWLISITADSYKVS